MTKEELIRNLKYTMEKHKNDKVDTFGTNISLMCKDVLDYLEQPTTKDCLVVEDCVSRQAVIDMTGLSNWFESSDDYNNFVEAFCKLPPVTPTHGTCKDCKYWKDSDGVYRRGISAESKCPLNILQVFDGDFYCADFERKE